MVMAPERIRHTIVDPQNQGVAVATFEHPTRYQAGSQVLWNFQNTTQPVLVGAWTAVPDGSEVFELLPFEHCHWLEPNLGMRPVGSQHLGSTLLPPMPAEQALVQFLIPKYRGNRPGLRLVGAGLVPDLAQQLRAVELQQVQTTGVRATIAYTEGGRTTMEDFYSCHFVLPPVPGQFVQQNWGLTRTFCFRAEESRLPGLREEFMRIARSVFYSQGWMQRCNQILHQLNGQFEAGIQARFDQLRADAQFQQELSAFNQQQRDHQSAAVAASVTHQSEVNAARSYPTGGPGGGGRSAQEAWGDELMGRTAYHDPSNPEGNYHYDDSHSQYMWTDGQGEYVGTDDANYDPNIGSDRTWTQAKRA